MPVMPSDLFTEWNPHHTAITPFMEFDGPTEIHVEKKMLGRSKPNFEKEQRTLGLQTRHKLVQKQTRAPTSSEDLMGISRGGGRGCGHVWNRLPRGTKYKYISKL